MTLEREWSDPNIWRPQTRFHADIGSQHQLDNFNSVGGIAVFIDVLSKDEPHIRISGSQSRDSSFWETMTRSGFVTKPKFSAGLLTIRFVTRGQMFYVCPDAQTLVSPSIAALTRFEDLQEVRAIGEVHTVSATIAATSLISANQVLTGDNQLDLPPLAPIADMARPGMQALYHTVCAVRRRLQEADHAVDLILPLLQEIISYQLLSSWPRRADTSVSPPSDLARQQLCRAVDYIDENLATMMTLADVANASGVSIRSLQLKFKKEMGQTPIQFIIERRLKRTHEDLISLSQISRSINEIASSWGFTHMSDFSQRYRRLYGCTPSKTRRDALHDRGYQSLSGTLADPSSFTERT